MLRAAPFVHEAAAGVRDIEDEPSPSVSRRGETATSGVPSPRRRPRLALDPDRVAPQSVAIQARERVELGGGQRAGFGGGSGFNASAR